MTDLSPDEVTILLIAAREEPMMPIGRWKKPMEDLVAKGLLRPRPHVGDPTGFFNIHITDAGRAAVVLEETAYDQQLGDMVTLSNRIGHDQKRLVAQAEQIAVQMVDLSEASNKITGDDKVEALRNWARVILERALEKMQ